MLIYNQYDIVIVNLDPTLGSEIKKKRPCLIISPYVMNKHLATVVICPITSQSKNYPSRVSFVLEDKINWIIIDQIRTIDKSRVIKYLTTLDNKSIDMVKDVIQETFVK